MDLLTIPVWGVRQWGSLRTFGYPAESGCRGPERPRAARDRHRHTVEVHKVARIRWGPTVGDDYAAPFSFNGTIVRAEVKATGPVVRDPVAEVAAILAAQ
jgi:hypothetical protein